jgi:diaminopimelate decarboxylase
MSNEFKKRLYHRLPEIGQEFGQSIIVLDEVGIRNTVREMIDGAAAAGIKGYKEYFAVKAAPYPFVLRIIKEEGGGFDCSSPIEVMLAREAGALPEDIMFTSNNTTTEEFNIALDEGGSIVNLDDISFLDHPVIQDFTPETMCFRINPGPLRKDDSVIGIPEEAKYGIMVSEISEAYRRAQEMGVKEFGIHTMICSSDNFALSLSLSSDYYITWVGSFDSFTNAVLFGGTDDITFTNADTLVLTNGEGAVRRKNRTDCFGLY